MVNSVLRSGSTKWWECRLGVIGEIALAFFGEDRIRIPNVWTGGVLQGETLSAGDVREIRSSEKRMWTLVLELASFCSDYPQASAKDKQVFFATIQNAMHWAVAQETAADFVYRSVDSALTPVSDGTGSTA